MRYSERCRVEDIALRCEFKFAFAVMLSELSIRSALGASQRQPTIVH